MNVELLALGLIFGALVAIGFILGQVHDELRKIRAQGNRRLR